MKKEVEKLLQYVQKPARYIGGELNAVVKDKDKIDIRYAFCFPDTYEIGMSHLGMKILYGLVNDREDSWCERVFAPDNDMEEQLRKNNVPLFALESGDYIKDFDMIGFTLQYELSYTNVLNMLNLAQIPLKSSDRENLTPLICVGGPCACNPEPITDFVDIVFLGDGEETTNQVIDLLIDCKKKGLSKKEFLLKAKDVTGIYVPSFYEDSYNEDGTLKELKPLYGAPEKVKKAVVSDMNKVFYPKEFVVPYINIVHDRAVEEIFRGCIRGCRFCQAGFIYRPIREKSVETINKQSKALIDSTGYDELSLCSLSTSDHSEVNNMLTTLIDWTVKENINLSLPSLRVDNFSDELVEQLNKVRRSGLTFAPEAGTQRLRDVINKNVTQEEVIRTCTKAFDNGWTSVKLYFMMGLPTETMEDIEGIANLGMDGKRGRVCRCQFRVHRLSLSRSLRFNGNLRTVWSRSKLSKNICLNQYQPKKLGFHITKLRPRFLKVFLPVVTDVSERLYFVRMSLAVNLILGTTNLILTLGCRLLKKTELTPIFTLTENVNFQNFYLGIILITV